MTVIFSKSPMVYLQRLKVSIFFLNEDKAKINKPIISVDATKAAFIQTTGTIGKYDIRIKDNLKAAPTSTVLYTLTIPSEADQYSVNIYFVNGAKKYND